MAKKASSAKSSGKADKKDAPKKATSKKRGGSGLEVAPARSKDESRNISIRKITNGYTVTESGTNTRGQYFDRTTYSPTKPTLGIMPAKKGAP